VHVGGVLGRQLPLELLEALLVLRQRVLQAQQHAGRQHAEAPDHQQRVVGGDEVGEGAVAEILPRLLREVVGGELLRVFHGCS
jgi:hypothetical protein